MSNLVDEEVIRFFEQTGMEGTYQQEAYFHAQWHRYRQQLKLFNAAMENCNVEEDVRREVIRQVLFGGPDEAAAIDRLREQKKALDAASGMPPITMWPGPIRPSTGGNGPWGYLGPRAW